MLRVYGFGHKYLNLVRLSSQIRRAISENAQRLENIDTSNNKFRSLGLRQEILNGLSAQNISDPTPVQKAVIPRLLARENIVLAASTGSGKTLTYSLPVIQSLLADEVHGYQRVISRPRCLVLVPTRELAGQVLTTFKFLSHFSKVSSTSVVGGVDYGKQKRQLDRMIDIVVGSPGRLLQHRDQGNVYFSQVNTVIIDEVDTMLTQGFGSEIRSILRNVFGRVEKTSTNDSSSSVQVIMATATLTKAVRVLLDDMKNGGFNIEYSDAKNKTPKKLDGSERRVPMSIVEVDGLHRILSNVQHKFEESKGIDKVSLLKTVISRMTNKKVLIFCNTIDSCRAVDHAINDDGQVKSICYHGDMPSDERQANMEAFRNGTENILVCTDIAARGIDIPEIDHVVMFDFPMNPIDYIHRAGRCGRAGRPGCVTSLITKRDIVLSSGIKNCIKKGLPIDSLTSSKRDYQDGGKLSSVAGRSSTRRSATQSSTPYSSRRTSNTYSKGSFRASSSGSSVKDGQRGNSKDGRRPLRVSGPGVSRRGAGRFVSQEKTSNNARGKFDRSKSRRP